MGERIGVSASRSPWQRPALAPWFSKPQAFDGFAVRRVDRIARRALHFASLLDWCREHSKTFASATEPFDLSTPMGRMFAQLIAMLAEGELRRSKSVPLARALTCVRLADGGRYSLSGCHLRNPFNRIRMLATSVR